MGSGGQNPNTSQSTGPSLTDPPGHPGTVPDTQVMLQRRPHPPPVPAGQARWREEAGLKVCQACPE